jgi:hypothetical protein
MIVFIAVVITTGVILYTLSVRRQDLPAPVLFSPTTHLEERKAAIYENLRDLQFEYRVGKLSDQDYQQTKTDLQRELAGVLAEIDRLTAGGKPAVATLEKAAASAPAKSAAAPSAGTTCPRCGAQFAQALKFCGECGSPMAGGAS